MGASAALAAQLNSVASAQDNALAKAAAIDQAVQAAIGSGGCPSAVVIVTRNGELRFQKAYGVANLETDTPASPESIYRLGSLTKQFTAAAVVKLAADGRLGLDDRASRHLPLLGRLKPFTLRELMNHTAGLRDGEESAVVAGASGPKSSIDLAREVASQAKPFDFAPGSAWLYSNANYVVLGAVIEAVTGKPLGQALKDLIFQPLGLPSLAVDSAAAVIPGRVSGYTPSDLPQRYENAAFIEIGDTGGAGAMRGAAGDLCRWHAALLSNALFGPTWVEAMLTPGRLRDGRLSGANRYSPDDASYGDTQYGLGLLLPPPTRQGRSILHYGYVNGFSACLETLVDLKVTTAVLCNADVGPNLPFRGVRRAVAESFAVA